ncbi:semaphorin-5B-like [Dreissena polymorpha]|uniref:semaphorin-5B-like n=1 Tax=Dreissena polymorpha TaxID=45954 RepID=UPI0022655D8C|nr:semaphorin-5B-like [Dreissena polymorpha]
MKTRLCDSPAPMNGGKPCEGKATEATACKQNPCKAESNSYSADYKNKCPTNYLTCASGKITCIDKNFLCDSVTTRVTSNRNGPDVRYSVPRTGLKVKAVSQG